MVGTQWLINKCLLNESVNKLIEVSERNVSLQLLISSRLLDLYTDPLGMQGWIKNELYLQNFILGDPNP